MRAEKEIRIMRKLIKSDIKKLKSIECISNQISNLECVISTLDWVLGKDE